LPETHTCRNIRTLANFEPPASDAELRASALQFVRKPNGCTRPSRADEAVFDRAVEEVALAAQRLVDGLVSNAPARDREVETVKARARSAKRFGARVGPVARRHRDGPVRRQQDGSGRLPTSRAIVALMRAAVPADTRGMPHSSPPLGAPGGTLRRALPCAPGPRSASERMRAVALAGTRLVSAHTLEAFVDVLRDACAQVMPLDDLGIGLYDAASHVLHFTAGFADGIHVPARSVSVTGTPSERVIRERRTLVTLRSDDPAAAGALLLGTGRRSESIIRTPILAEDRVLGVIMVQSSTPGLYGAEDVEVLETLASVTATALLNLELLAQRDGALRALRETEGRFNDLAGSIPQVFWIVGPDAQGVRRIQFVSTAFRGVFGREPEAVLGADDAYLACVHPGDRARVRAVMSRQWTQDLQLEYRIVRPDGEARWVEVRTFRVRDDAGQVVRVAGICEDITEHRHLEHRLRDAQKMEAIGQLAGGIAHDFNNLLTVITANLEFVREDLAATHAAHGDLDQIGLAAVRARALVRQLMTFSRRQPVQLQAVDVGALVAGAERQLRRLIDDDVLLQVRTVPEAVVRADPAQLEQVLHNLALNARDAMLTACHGYPGTGGTLSIEVDRVHLSPADAPEGAGAGSFVRLRVRDTGHGMDDGTRARLFEPFFTTRDVGAGTGLGLATVFGIIRSLGGSISVASAPCEGATFTTLLPALAAAAAAGPPAAAAAAGGRTVLLVDDEEPVRTTASRMLRRGGYRVLDAEHAAAAMLLWASHASVIDVLLTDLRMPDVGGRELADALLAERPALPVVFMSGYAGEVASVTNGPAQAFVEKPFTADSLLQALEAVLSAA
jgi:PAS domain S-box-containing protein